MIIDGRAISQTIQNQLHDEVDALSHTPNLAILYVGDDPVIDSFIRIKERFGRAIGVTVTVFRHDMSATTEELVDEINLIVRSENEDGAKLYDGIVVQLPLPSSVDVDRILNAVPRTHDPDVLSESALAAFTEGSLVMPPVVGAVREVMRISHTTLPDRNIVVVGEGRLVGDVIGLWLKRQNIPYTVITKDTQNPEEVLRDADIIISGAGDPGFITADMVKEGAVLIDAGTSESGGVVVGDLHPGAAEKASVFTPVPGGIGPITVAVLFRNLLMLREERMEQNEVQ